jgi:AcrR family transcriptional regulator
MLIDAAKQDTKLPAIMKAAVRLFVERGISSTTIRDIARAAKVAEGTLYRHYASKEDLARDIFVTNLGNFTAFLEEKTAPYNSLGGRLRGLAEGFAQAYENNTDLARFILFSHAGEMGKIPKSTRQPREVVEAILRDAIKHDEIPKNADVDLLQALILGALSRLMLARTYGELKSELSSHSAEVGRLLERMLTGQPTP